MLLTRLWPNITRFSSPSPHPFFEFFFKKSDGDFQTCIYFTEKGLEIARLSEDLEAEADANRSLGLAYEQLGNINVAIDFHERQRQLAEMAQDGDEFTDANKHLIDTYRMFAEECEQKGDFEKAVEYHEKCMEAARQVRGGGWRDQYPSNAFCFDVHFFLPKTNLSG